MGNVLNSLIADTTNFSFDSSTNTLTLLNNIIWGSGGYGYGSFEHITLPINYIFDGNHKTIDMSGIETGGIFIPSSSTSSIDEAPIIKKVGILNGTTGDGQGLLSPYDTEYIIIEDCYSTGAIEGDESGGIIGSSAGSDSGHCIIRRCYSTGEISGRDSGGIAADYAGEDSGLCVIENCYSVGEISGEEAGGIVGGFPTGTSTSGTCTITNCYSRGTVSGTNAGGISGSKENADSSGNEGTITVTNCYSTRTDTTYSSGSDTITYTGTSFLFIDGFSLTSNLLGTIGTFSSSIWLVVSSTSYPMFVVSCIHGDAKVKTLLGYKPIKDITTTDLIITHKNKITSIRSVHKSRYNGDKLYIIKKNQFGKKIPSDDIIVTPNHRYKLNGKWFYPKDTCDLVSVPDGLDLYHIQTKYDTDTIIVNKLAMETSNGN
jgi:hypothetical protein